ncbi:uncharacterized protein LOC112455935 isoform X1 [Temnothorax curvispinosus]|uniref:Sulfurtransferase n=2 Tax=Temnothorax curvispinosus TaxID=300111 RepID=A0A6J1PX40_9HYME|nr:uncharacterized protein LOC112455935 isoform X1 [Temnothorax curvispinosus]
MSYHEQSCITVLSRFSATKKLTFIMYTRFSRRLYQASTSYALSSRSRGNPYVSPLSPRSQRFFEITLNRPSAGNLIRTLYSSNIFCREKDSAALCENGMALEVNYEQLLEEQKEPNTLIVDIREPSEISETGALPGSIHIPMGDVRNVFENFSEEEFQEKYGKPKPTTDTKIIFSCRSGKRSMSMQQTMQKLGYTQAHHYPGGWLEWEEKSAGRRK